MTYVFSQKSNATQESLNFKVIQLERDSPKSDILLKANSLAHYIKCESIVACNTTINLELGEPLRY